MNLFFYILQSNSDVITAIALHCGLENQVAIGTEKGVVYIFQLPSPLPGQNKKVSWNF